MDIEKIIDIHLNPVTTNIYIIGYYGHDNLGDESYKLSFDYIFKTFLPDNDLQKYNIEFVENINTKSFIDSDIIILGGGDVLNEYFIDKIILKFKNKPNKIIAVSVGIPYIDIIINTNKLNIIDYVFVRTKQDLDLFKNFFNLHRIFYLQDISYYLLNITNNNKINNEVKNEIKDVVDDVKFNSILTKLNILKQNNKKIIAITLNRHIYHENYKDNYYQFINIFTNFVIYLLSLNYHIVFLPFCTSKHDYQNDILIHNDIINNINVQIKYNHRFDYTNIDFTIHAKDILKLYDCFYATVPMRFHATLFSIYKCVPMFPIFTTRKIKNLLLDISYEHYYELNTNDIDIPELESINETVLVNKFNNLIECKSDIQTKFNNLNRDYQLENNIYDFVNLINTNYTKLNNNNSSVVDLKIQEIFQKVQNLALEHNYTHFTQITDKKLQYICIQIISYNLTNGSINSIYNYGLSQKMFKLNEVVDYYKEWKWVINDNIKKKYSSKLLYNNPYGLFNINYIDQVDYSGVHRSGWQYVYENIKYLHNSQSNLFLDLYLDRTFHWNKEVNKILGLIPYKQPWIGFIHHTFDTSFSDYNCYNMISNPDFIESLKHCKGLFVLSETLRLKLLQELNAKFNGLFNVPIFALIHPTETNDIPTFSYEKWLSNNDKKIINIGAWLRDIFSFYYLTIPNKYTFTESKTNFCPFKKKIEFQDTIRKVALKGSHMNNYYPSCHFTNNIVNFLKLEENNQFITQNISQNNISTNISTNVSTNISHNVSHNVSHDEITNNWYRHFNKFSKNICNSVDIIDKLTNIEYDTLLTNNIVFINLVDASAVNTIIECIVRNTPIIVNSCPAVIELLGPNYPLYFNDNLNYFEMNKQVVTLLSDTSNIKKAHKYLTSLNKSKLNIEYFKQQFIKIITNSITN